MNPSIFRAYDIRGVHGRDFADADFEKIGNAMSAHAKHVMIVGRDCRLSSPGLKASAIKGLAAAGIDVMDVGMVPRGASMFWSHKTKQPVLYVTASHMPPEWNGLKLVFPNGTSLDEKGGKAVKEFVLSGRERRAEVAGIVEQTPVLNEYRKFIREKIPIMERGMRVLLDCGNGTAGLSAPNVFNDHGCETSVLFAEPDGRFPNRPSEIKESTLKEAMKRSGDFDIVLAFDGDADRLALVDNTGRYVTPDTTACLIMSQLLKEQKGPVTANLESGRIIDKVAGRFGRKVIRTPVGYTHVLDSINKNKCCFGLERSMHFMIPSVMPMDDAITAGLYAAYALSKTERTLAEFVDSSSQLPSRMVNFTFPTDEDKFAAMAELKAELLKRSKKANTMDGVRLDFDAGWVLARASNTSPLLRLTVEGESQKELESLMAEYHGLVREFAERRGGAPEMAPNAGV